MGSEKGTTIWLRTTDEQYFYTSGEAINGEMVIELESSLTTLQSLRVTLTYTETLDINLDVSTHKGFDAFVDLITEPVRRGPGIYRFPFRTTTPSDAEDYPPTFTQTLGLWSRYEIAWSLTGRLKATVAEHGLAAPVEQQIVRTRSVPINVFPARRGQQNAVTPQTYSVDAVASKRMRVTMRSPTVIPQAPELCDIKVTIEPFAPVYVKSIDVYLQRDLALWVPSYGKPLLQKIPIGRVVLGQRLASKLELDGRVLGWGLRSTQPETFLSCYGCLNYKLCVAIHMRRRYSQNMQRAFVYVAPLRHASDDTQDIPSYCSEDSHDGRHRLI